MVIRGLINKKLLSELAPKYHEHLSYSGTINLSPWQREIVDYVQTGRYPSAFAQHKLYAWGKRMNLA